MPQTNVGRSEDLLAELAAWVRLETPTTDPAAVNRLMDVAEAELRAGGAALTRIPGRDGFGDNLIARTPGRGRSRSWSPGIWTRSGRTARWTPCPTR